jgi:hypothetical protein
MEGIVLITLGFANEKQPDNSNVEAELVVFDGQEDESSILMECASRSMNPLTNKVDIRRPTSADRVFKTPTQTRAATLPQ